MIPASGTDTPGVRATIAAQPDTYAVVGVDEAPPPAIFVLPVIGWIARTETSSTLSPIVLVSIELENAVDRVKTLKAVVAGDALVLDSRALCILDIVIGPWPKTDGYRDRFKIVLARNKKVKS